VGVADLSLQVLPPQSGVGWLSMTYPTSFSGSMAVANEGWSAEQVMEAVVSGVERENGWLVSKGARELELTGRAWRLGLSSGALTLATTGSVRLTEEAEGWRVDYRIRLTSVVLLSIVGGVWVGVPLWLVPGIPRMLAVLLPAAVFLVITGAVFVRSSRRFARTLARHLSSQAAPRQ
jgi:hypothetical protein